VSRRRFPLWTLLAAVLVVALVIGSGVLSSSPPTAAQRAGSIESSLRCPSCEDLSVAESSASTAVTVRATVAQLIAEGRTDQQIESFLVARYGASIVLDPPARGWSLLVWLLPLLGGVAALAGLVTVLIRRRDSSDPAPAGGVVAGGGGGPVMTGEAASERRYFLTQSLADADAEYLAGDLSDADYLALRHRDMLRLASLDAAGAGSVPAGSAGAGVATADGDLDRRTPTDVLVADDPPPSEGPEEIEPLAEPGASGTAARPPRPRRGRRSWWFLAGAVVAFGAALVVAVSLFATDRQPGQSVTGSFSETPQQQIEETLAQAATDENSGQVTQAVRLYQSVLTKQADNEVALAQLGWLEFETGRQGSNATLISNGRAKLNRAVQLDPHDYAVRLYLGTVLMQADGNAAGAVAQYRQFLADDPPADLVEQAAPELREAYRKAGVPLPAAAGG
jgi:cytochrome c-type biogenesis protein CcmH